MNTPSVLLAIVLCFILIASPRRFFLFPFIMAACFVPMNQQIEILSFNFGVLRLLIITGILKLTIFEKKRVIQWNLFDKLILIWAVVGSMVYIAQQANLSAVINRSGVMFDTLGMYWLFRHVLHGWEDVSRAVKFFALFAIITAPLIALEKFHESSFFSVFGPTLGQFHRGRYRAAGPFSHYITMGCFWASLLPLFYAQFKAGTNKLLFFTAIVFSLSNIYYSASTTPIMTVLAIIIFWNFYNYRMHGKIIFTVICLVLFLLHLIMKQPVWHLMARANIFGGSTGYHRYFLFDNFVNHVSEWFLLGTKSTSHWGWSQFDITNQFVLEGVRGGIITLLIFIIIIYFAVKIPCNLSLGPVTHEVKWVSWGICVTMLGQFVTFWGVAYFGQINMLLYFFFALVGFTFNESNST